MSALEKAISLAALAHEGQKDKAGKSYYSGNYLLHMTSCGGRFFSLGTLDPYASKTFRHRIQSRQ